MNIYRVNHIVVIFMIAFVFIQATAHADHVNFEQQLNNIYSLDDPKQKNKKLSLLLEQSEFPLEQKFNVYRNMANNFHQLGELDLAIRQMHKSQRWTKQQQEHEQEAQSFKLIGVYSYFKGDLEGALKAYRASLGYYKQQDEPIKQANLFNNIGLVYSAMGKYSQALFEFQQAQPLYQEFGSDVDQNDILSNIAGLYMHLGLYNKAITLFKKVLQKRTEFGDDQAMALTHSEMGLVYMKAEQFDLAEKYFRLAYYYYVENNMLYEVAEVLNHFTEFLNLVGRYDEVHEFSEQCIKFAKDQEHMVALAGCHSSLAKVLFYQGRLDLALEHLEKSNQNSQDYNLLQITNINLKSLIFASQGLLSQALEHSNDYIIKYREMNNNSLYDALARYESGQLEQQIKQLEQSTKLQQLVISKSQQQLIFTIIITAFSIILSIIFYRRKAEKRIKMDLSNKVKRRTLELEKLTIQLKQANKVKTQFLANMSHEIRTPLTAILGYSEAHAHGENYHTDMKRDMQVVHRNSEHLLQLVNDILDLSKIEAGKFESDIDDVNLMKCLDEIKQTFSEQAKQKQLIFEIKHQLPQPFMIKTDRFRLKQILFNLCSNAIKFTDSGQVLINVALADNTLEFSVVDTGIGMGQSQISQIFDRFNQGNNDISRRFGGTGLGLFLSDKLAKMLGGKIIATSTLNEGSTFTLSIPYVKGVLVDKGSFEMQHKPIILPKNMFSGKILLADDYVDNRQLISRLLKHLGFDVVVAENGLQALSLYKSELPDVIFLDIQMPEMDGIDTLMHLKQIGSHKPIYALTANAMAHEIDEYIEYGFSGHIQKPIDRSELLNVLKRHFNVNQGTDLTTHDEPYTQSQMDSLADTPADSTDKVLTVKDNVNDVDLSDLVVLFKAELDKDLQRIEQSLTAEDFQQVLDICHRISGAAAVFGFEKLGDISKKIDIVGKQEDYQQLPALVKAMVNEINQIKR